MFIFIDFFFILFTDVFFFLSIYRHLFSYVSFLYLTNVFIYSICPSKSLTFVTKGTVYQRFYENILAIWYLRKMCLNSIRATMTVMSKSQL